MKRLAVASLLLFVACSDTALHEDKPLCLYFQDSDGDSFGDAGSYIRRPCDVTPPGYCSDSTDCDDTDAAVRPDADELCDGIDNNCDEAIDGDDAMDPSIWFEDRDEDGFGDPWSTMTECDAPSGFVADGTDCDDFNNTIYPGAEELCDGLDNDCDGEIEDQQAWHADADGDEWGSDWDSIVACDPPDGWVNSGGDCDDEDGGVNPDAEEICDDDIDNDCNGEIDEFCDETCGPVVDLGFTTETPSPDLDLVVVREEFHPTLDLSNIGYSTYADVQSIYLRFYGYSGAGRVYQYATVTFSSGLTIVGLIADAGVLEATDSVFGVLPAANFAGDARGMERGAIDFFDDNDSIYDRTDHGLSLEWTIRNIGLDDLRILVTHDDPTSCETLDISLDPIGELGIQVGDVSSGITDAADFGEVSSVRIGVSD